VSEEKNQEQQNQGSNSDLDAIKKNRDDILAEKQELKSKYDSLLGKSTKLEETISALGKLVGVQEGEDITSKAQELIKAKEQEAFEKMSDIEKLNHRLKGLEEELTANKLEKEKAQKEALGLKIDSTLKNSLKQNGVSDEVLEDALTIFKAKTQIDGLENDHLLIGDQKAPINQLMESFLGERKHLIKNPSKNGSSFKGGAPEEKTATKQVWDKARKTKNYVGVVSQMLNQTTGE